MLVVTMGPCPSLELSVREVSTDCTGGDPVTPGAAGSGIFATATQRGWSLLGMQMMASTDRLVTRRPLISSSKAAPVTPASDSQVRSAAEIR